MADIAAAKRKIVQRLIFEEGVVLKPYLCAARVPTIGVGSTRYPDGRKVTMADPPITREQAMQMLEHDLEQEYIPGVLSAIGDAPTTTNQLVELVVCAYNIGVPRMRTSSMMRLHKAGDYAGAARAFGLWNNVTRNGRLEDDPILTARRAREAAGYLTPDDGTVGGQMPQAVAGESSLAKSPIQQSGVVTVATGAVALAGSAFESIKPLLKDATEAAAAFGVSPGVVLGVVLLVTGGTTMYWRWKQRTGGWS